MKLEDLRAAQVDERGTDSLRPLRPTFYEEAADYLAELRARRDRLAGELDDPFDSAEVRQLTDELETAEEVVEALYERRVGKVLKRASLAAAGMPADEEGLTEEERALFADLVDRIEANRAEVLETLDNGTTGDSSGGEPAVEAPRPSPPDGPAEAGAEAAGEGTPDSGADDVPPEPSGERQPEPDGGGARPATADSPELSAPDEAGELERVTVRITAPVGEIYGVDDHVYTLDAEDVVTLPTPNAAPLLERGAAQRVE